MIDNESNELHREAQAAGARVDAYLDTINRSEPDIAMVDHDAAMASIAISLKRIADALTYLAWPSIVLPECLVVPEDLKPGKYEETGS